MENKVDPWLTITIGNLTTITNAQEKLKSISVGLEMIGGNNYFKSIPFERNVKPVTLYNLKVRQLGLSCGCTEKEILEAAKTHNLCENLHETVFQLCIQYPRICSTKYFVPTKLWYRRGKLITLAVINGGPSSAYISVLN